MSPLSNSNPNRRFQNSRISWLTLLALGTGLLPGARFAVADDCSKAQNQIKAVAQFKSSGQTKLLAAAYAWERQAVDDQLKKIPKTLDPFGANPELCRWPAITHLSQATIKDECFGIIPSSYWPKFPGDRRDEASSTKKYNEPVQIRMDHFTIPHLALQSKPDIHCANNVCDVDTHISQINVNFNLNLNSVNDKCYQLALRKVKLSLNPKVGPAHAHFRLKFTNDLAEPVQILWDHSTIEMPKDAIQDDSKNAEPSETGVCKKGLGFLESSKPILHRVVRSPLIVNQLLKTLKDGVLKDLAHRAVITVAKMNGVGSSFKDVAVPLPPVTQIMDGVRMQDASDQQVAGAKDYLSRLRAARTIPELRENAISRDLKQLAFQAKDSVPGFIRRFTHASNTDASELVGPVIREWQDVVQQLRSLLTKKGDGLSANDEVKRRRILQDDLSIAQSFVKSLQAFAERLRGKPDPTPIEDVELQLAAIQANKLKGEFYAYLGACPRCLRSGLAKTASSPGKFKDTGQDVAFQIGLDGINQALAAMTQAHFFDACFEGGHAPATCADADKSDSITRLHLTQPPTLEWNSDLGLLVIRIKHGTITNQNNGLDYFGRKMTADIGLPCTLFVSPDGKSIHFSPVGSLIQLTNRHFSGSTLDQYKYVPSVVARYFTWISQKLGNIGYVHSLIKQKLKLDFKNPNALKLVNVDPSSNPGKLTVYFKLPSDPDQLLSALNLGQTTTSKEVLK